MTSRISTSNPALSMHLAVAVTNRLRARLDHVTVIEMVRDVLGSYGASNFTDIEDGHRTEALRIICIRLNVNPEFFSL